MSSRLNYNYQRNQFTLFFVSDYISNTFKDQEDRFIIQNNRCILRPIVSNQLCVITFSTYSGIIHA